MGSARSVPSRSVLAGFQAGAGRLPDKLLREIVLARAAQISAIATLPPGRTWNTVSGAATSTKLLIVNY